MENQERNTENFNMILFKC